MYPGDLSLLGSVGWLVDRTAEKKEIIGSVWKVKEDELVTCASLLLPFNDHPEALAIEFPLSKQLFGVKELVFHNYFDRWMAKRKLAEASYYPDVELTASPYNLAGIKLSPSIKRLDRDSLTTIKRKIWYNKVFEEPDLTGQADNLQVVSILQTLMNARNIGTMMLIDAQDKILARFCLGDQKITHVQYQNLFNEQAFNKLMCTLEEELKFIFIREIDPLWTNFPPMQKSTAALLMNAHAVMDESAKLYQEVGGKDIEIRQVKDELSLTTLAEEKCPPVACVWNHIRFPVSISRVVRSCSFDGATVLNSMKYLVDTGQARIGKFDPPPMNSKIPLPLVKDFTLKKGWEVYCLSVDHTVSKGCVDLGYILDPLGGSDSQLVHTIGVPQEACGSPIVMQDQVVGIHSGPLIDNFEVYKDWIHPGIMITAEHIYDCMSIKKPSTVSVQEQIKTTETEEETLFEVKTIDINERLTEDVEDDVEENDDDSRYDTTQESTIDLLKEADKLSGFFKSVAGMLSSIGTSGEGINSTLLRQSLDSSKYEKSSPDTKLLIGDFIKVRMKALSDCFVIVLFRAGPEQPIEFLYPPEDRSMEVSKGESIDIPPNTISMVSAGVMQTYSGIPLNFKEQHSEIVIAFSFRSILNQLFDEENDTKLKELFEDIIEEKNLVIRKFRLEKAGIKRASNDDLDKSDPHAIFASHLSIKTDS